MIQAIAFDLDGTLCDTIPDLTAAANATRAHFGQPALPASTIRRYIGDGVGELIHRTLTNDYHGTADPAQWQTGLDYFCCYYADHIADHSQLYPDCAAVLTRLQQRGIALAVVTNKEENLARKLLAHFQILPAFRVILGGDSLPRRKPDAMMLAETARRLALPVDALLMVGDSHNDILVSKNAGCASVLVRYGYGDVTALQNDPQTRPDYLIDALTQLETLC